MTLFNFQVRPLRVLELQCHKKFIKKNYGERLFHTNKTELHIDSTSKHRNMSPRENRWGTVSANILVCQYGEILSCCRHKACDLCDFCWFVFFLGDNWRWTQGLAYAKQALYHWAIAIGLLTFLFIFQTESVLLSCLGWPWTHNLLASASKAAEIIDMYYTAWPFFSFKHSQWALKYKLVSRSGVPYLTNPKACGYWLWN